MHFEVQAQTPTSYPRSMTHRSAISHLVDGLSAPCADWGDSNLLEWEDKAQPNQPWTDYLDQLEVGEEKKKSPRNLWPVVSTVTARGGLAFCEESSCSPLVCVGFLQQSKDMQIGVSLTGEYEIDHRCECESCLFVSICCDTLATCPGCTSPLGLCQLGYTLQPPPLTPQWHHPFLHPCADVCTLAT